MRLIDADALKKKAVLVNTDEECYSYILLEDVMDAPTIEERKMGRWEFVSYGNGLGNYHCSECRAIAGSYFTGSLGNRHWEYKLTKYCGNCGVKMEGTKE